jgi:hypothetical protein
MTICARPGCTAEGLPKYCSRRCSAIHIAYLNGPGHYQRISKQGMNLKRQKGHKVLRQADLLLMAAGRYGEAARVLYDRGYLSGYNAARRNHRQLPAREFGERRARSIA